MHTSLVVSLRIAEVRAGIEKFASPTRNKSRRREASEQPIAHFHLERHLVRRISMVVMLAEKSPPFIDIDWLYQNIFDRVLRTVDAYITPPPVNLCP